MAAAHALSVNTPQKQVQVKKGDNITLPCTYESSVVTPAKGDIVAWMKMPEEVGSHGARHMIRMSVWEKMALCEETGVPRHQRSLFDLCQ